MNPGILFERNTLQVMATSGLFAGLLVFCTPLHHIFIFAIFLHCMLIVNTFFHEMGHATVAWLFGMPAIPSILTLFGSDQASGVTLVFDRNWFVQIFAFAAMAYGCYHVRLYYPRWFWPVVALTLAVIGVAFTRYYRIPEIYMGNGGSIFMGSYFLMRAWRDRFPLNNYARWVRAFLGFFLVFNMVRFAGKLLTDAAYRQDYASPTFGGSVDNDFIQIADFMWKWSVQNIAMFTLIYAAVALLLPPLLACWSDEDEG